MKQIRTLLGSTAQADEICTLWQEYEDATTNEALFVKDLDKYEMIVQALEYEKGKQVNNRLIIITNSTIQPKE
jgi:putative hydrolase of HD superfamily